MKHYYLLLFLSLMFFGCVSFKETHLFRDNTPVIPNYYKLDVSGNTWFGKAKFVSGYFNDAAVSEYFGEFDQPPNYTFLASKSEKTNDEHSVKLEGELENKKLVMILSSNSKAVADQIGSIAQSQQLNAALMSMASRDKVVSLQEAKIRSNQNKEYQRASIGYFEANLKSLTADSSYSYNRIPLFAAVNSLLQDIGYQGEAIRTMSDLKNTLKQLRYENQ